MTPSETCKKIASNLPSDLQLVPAAVLRQTWQLSEPTLWRAERRGELVALRIGRRRFYRVCDLRSFLDRAAKRSPLAMPWRIGRRDGES